MPPRVSIILPTYNAAQYLGEALDSLARQTFADWELIVVDDGSTDNTAAQLAQARPDARRQVIRQTNAGSASARNRGLRAAAGELVAFLDVDDGWQADYLTRMVAALDAAPDATAAFCGWQYCDETGQLLPQVVQLSPQEVSQLDQLLLWRNAIMPSSLVARREAVVALGGFDETLRSCEDWDLWLRLIKLGRFVAVPHILTRYRAHAGSKTERVAIVEQARLKLNAKHLGSLDDPLAEWPALRRQAVGYTYFNAALAYLRQNNVAQALDKARQAITTWPQLLDLDDFYYELGCARQPRGLRGSATGLDLAAGEALIHDLVFDSATAAAPAAVHGHWAHANLVLARLARNTQQWPACRRYAWRALLSASGRGRLEATRLLARSVTPAGLLAARQRAPQRPPAPPPRSRISYLSATVIRPSTRPAPRTTPPALPLLWPPPAIR